MNADNSNNFWWVVSATVVGGLILTFLVSIKGYVWSFLTATWEIICMLFQIVFRILFEFRARRRVKRLLTDHYLRKHRSDGVVWTWTYDKGKVVVLNPVCEKDQGEMAQEFRSVKRPDQFLCDFVTLLRCKKCGFGSTPIELGDETIEQYVTADIEKKIAAGEYLKSENAAD